MDALPSNKMSFRTISCPMNAAIVVTAVKYNAVTQHYFTNISHQLRGVNMFSKVSVDVVNKITIWNRKTLEEVIFHVRHRSRENHAKSGRCTCGLHCG